MTKPGVIYKICVRDFVTYSYVEMFPGPNLNVVLGANGTGKSTIVAAIILGLGGSPKTIGRGTKVSEYVRHDCTEARIDIELFGEHEGVMHAITRVFNVANQNTWYINDKHVSDSDVKQLMDKLNIEVNNLCQFLPQDRVQDFAKMDKKELLVNTQRAVGRQDLVDKHKELVRMRNEQKTVAKDIDIVTAKLKQAEADLVRLEGKVNNLSEKNKIIAEIECVKRKICWENYNKLLSTKESVEEDRKQAAAVLNAHKKKIQPMENKIAEHKQLVSVLQNKLRQSRDHLSRLEAKLKDFLDKADDTESSVREILIEMRSKQQALLDHQNEIDAMKAKIDKLVNDEQALIAKYGSEPEIEKAAAKLTHEANRLCSASEESNRQRVSAASVLSRTVEQARQLEARLAEMENVRERRLQILRRRDPDAYNATMWLKDNRGMFRGHVYDPMMVELNVLDAAHCKYLENIVPMRDRVAFTCEYREDMNLLLEKVRDEQGLSINVVHSSAEHPTLASYRPPVPIEQLRPLGFFAYTNSLVTAPEPVLKYLCRMYSLHCIPIGDQSTYARASAVPDQIRLFFSDAHRFAVNVSRYTGEKSTRISDVESDGTLSVCMDHGRINDLRRELASFNDEHERMRAQIEALKAKTQGYENSRSELMKERQNLMRSKEQIRNIRERLRAARATLDQYLHGHKTAEEIKEEAGAQIKTVLKNSLQVHQAILDAFTDFDRAGQREEVASAELAVVQEQVTHMKNEVQELKSEFAGAQTTFDKIDAVYQRTAQDAAEALRAARRLSDGSAPHEPGFDKYRAQHDALPVDLSELRGLASELQARVECILTADDGELRAYEEAQRQADVCREQLAECESRANTLGAAVAKRARDWLEPLTDLVAQINSNFGRYFEAMGCAGEVVVSRDAGDEEFSEFGLSVRVTYRSEEPLQELNRYVQSGGERAVATAVYMLSMQELTAAPFRCVDEINQGMDPQNERRVFEILVHTTSQLDTCQYFLITPKLISGLKFGRAVKVHVVHNGPFCDVGKHFSIRSFLERRRSQPGGPESP